MSDDIFGQDIKIDETGQAMVAANGELVLTVGVETGVQDIRLRLFTPLGRLFYDQGFGALLYDWVKEENTPANRAALEAEVERRIQTDPRVVVGSSDATVTAWDTSSVVVHASWQFIEEDHPFNLVISFDANKGEMVIKDVDPRAGL